jgi:amino acid permease
MGGGTTVILSLAGWKIGRLLHRRTGSGRHRLASGFVIVVGIVVMVY